jgi:hypothetical protein
MNCKKMIHKKGRAQMKKKKSYKIPEGTQSWQQNMCVTLYVCLFERTRVCEYMCVCMRVCVCVCEPDVHVYMYACIHKV